MTQQEAIEAIRAAITDAGPHPEYHYTLMERHRAEWPTLWAALDALLAAPFTQEPGSHST